MYAFVGIIMLVGIVKKNAIMMIDFAIEAQRKEALAPEDAIFEACIMRFRPIMMTTMAALMGTLPIALGLGAGGEARRPLGLAVVGGLHRVAAAHALHHAGHLSLLRAVAELASCQAHGAWCRRRRTSPPTESAPQRTPSWARPRACRGRRFSVA